MPPLPLAGLRYSQGWGLLHPPAAGPQDAAALALDLDRRGVNLAFLAGRRAGGGLALTLAVDAERAAGPDGAAALAPAALLTAYPLTHCLPLAWRLTAGLARLGLDPLALATSPAAAALALPEGQLEPALAALAGLVQLPPGAAPQRQQVRVVQVAPGEEPPAPPRCQVPETIAVYREDPIRTYGLAAAPEMAWLCAAAPLAGLDFERGLTALADAPKPAHLQVALGAGRIGICACLAAAQAPALVAALLAAGLEPAGPPEPATLVHLQGPHFGDRHGIAAAALVALAEAGAAPLALAGVVHSIFIALPPEQAAPVCAALARRFCAPS
ncbi:MAG: hypothetical protein ACOZHQ_10905 [Thermodesulfobacteriota bacterium]